MTDFFKLDKYDIVAVLTPTIITAILCVLACVPIIDTSFLLKYYTEVPVFILSSGLMVVIFGAVFLVCMILVKRVGKHIIEPLFWGKNLQNMPTTTYLLYQSRDKNEVLFEKVRDKIKMDYDISLLTKTKEKNDPQNAISLINSAVKLIRKDVQNTNADMYNRKNRNYGQCRNFIGGCFIALVLSVILLTISLFRNLLITYPLCAGIVSLFLGLFFLSYYKSAAKDYANELFETYLRIK